MYPLMQEQNLPASATYDPDDERLFAETGQLFSDSANLCEKGSETSNTQIVTSFSWDHVSMTIMMLT